VPQYLQLIGKDYKKYCYGSASIDNFRMLQPQVGGTNSVFETSVNIYRRQRIISWKT